VSRSLSVECDPVSQPAATEPVERRTWSALRIRVGGRIVTRIWDKELADERTILYLPAFPVAEWIVRNWWALLNEPCRTERVPSPAPHHIGWIKRHCLRSADSGLLLPLLYLFNDGQGIHAVWQADECGDLANMLGEFRDTGSDHIDSRTTEGVLARFVSDVIGRVEDENDERIDDMRSNWNAIQSSAADESMFCVIAGRLGLDPYDPSQVGDALSQFIEHSLDDSELPVVRDLTEAAEADAIAQQWAWVQEARKQLSIGPILQPRQFAAPSQPSSPAERGYNMATELRNLAHLGPTSPVGSVQGVVGQAIGAAIRVEERDHLPSGHIRFVVGWAGGKTAVVAGPRPARADSERFHVARALYLSLVACERGERLVTDAYTWEQQASRAFAAEFLAPRAALVERTGGWADRFTIRELAQKYEVSSLVVERQLENARVPIVIE